MQQVQEALGRRIALENVSSYLEFPSAEYSEWDFLVEAARRSGCGILLDINNVYVNACNHGFDPREFLDAVPPGLYAIRDVLKAPVGERIWFAGEALSRALWGTAGGAWAEGERAAGEIAARLR